MATKKKKAFSDMLGEELTRSPIKKKLPDTSQIEAIAREEHKVNTLAPAKPKPVPTAKKVVKPVVKKEEKRISRTTFDFPTPIHRAMKRAAADEYTTLKNYVVMLIRKDLEEKGYLE